MSHSRARASRRHTVLWPPPTATFRVGHLFTAPREVSRCIAQTGNRERRSDEDCPDAEHIVYTYIDIYIYIYIYIYWCLWQRKAIRHIFVLMIRDDQFRIQRCVDVFVLMMLEAGALARDHVTA